MSTKQLGDEGEDKVCDYLNEKGFAIIDRNWRTRWCEIDVVAKKDNCVYFVEVKFRSSNAWGDGLDYITQKKQQQMRFAAEFWISDNNWQGEAMMAAASVDGSGNIEFIDSIS